MATLTENDIKAELSYAYLHAVTSRAGLICEVGGRLSDGAGVDAVIRAKERFHPESTFTDFPVEVQLKATSGEPRVDPKGRYPFSLAVKQYDTLRNTEAVAQRLLVVLYLPEDEARWLDHSAECLVSRRCAYWISLSGAPESSNATSQTVYIPQSHLFSVDGLRAIMTRLSLGERLGHAEP